MKQNQKKVQPKQLDAEVPKQSKLWPPLGLGRYFKDKQAEQTRINIGSVG